MLGVKMLHEDEGEGDAGVSREVIPQFDDRFNAARGRSNGDNSGVILVLSQHQAVRFREVLLSVSTPRFKAHEFPSVVGAEHAGLRENDGVIQIEGARQMNDTIPLY